jgi:hypothetical protein
MWDNYKKITKKIIIDKDFPNDVLINIMKPYLHLYYTSLYATNGTYKQCYAEYYLRRKLMRFRQFNPKFGRKVIHLKRDIFKKQTKIVEFNSKHINFYRQEFQRGSIQQNYYVDYMEDNVIDVAAVLINSVQRDTNYLNLNDRFHEDSDNDTQSDNNTQSESESNEEYSLVNNVPQVSDHIYMNYYNNNENDNENDGEEEREEESVS